MWNIFPRLSSESSRFAPTPTGSLHIGNAYSALLSIVSAKAFGHQSILRVDDLDVRSLPKGCIQEQLYDLAWLGLNFDEGLIEGGARGPYRQSQRFHIYQSALEYLNRKGLLYPCYCSRKEIATHAPHAQDEGFIYPGTCRPSEGTVLDLETIRRPREDGRIPALRFNTHAFQASSLIIDQTQSRVIKYHDLIFGKQSAHLDLEIGDFVVQRKDGIFAYQLACAVDDYSQNCSLVARGADLITSTHRQRLIFNALDLNLSECPQYAHVALVVDEHGERLAKRNQSIQLQGLRALGHKPAAIRASLSRCLGGPDTDNIETMVKSFTWDQLPTKVVPWSINNSL